MADKSKPNVKSINNLSALPKPPAGQKFSFKPAITIDQARGICAQNKVEQGWWLKNRVYYLIEGQSKPHPAQATQEGTPSCNG
jgi:hypothetical protein